MKIVRESKSEVSQNTPAKMKIVRESKSEVSQNTPKWKLSESPNPRCPRIFPPNENCHRIQIQGVPKCSPQMKIVIESKSEVSKNTPKWKLSESPNPRCSRIPPQNENCHRVQIQVVPEYSPPMKIVRESKPKVSQNNPQNENCQRVQIQGVKEYPPKMKIVIESKSEVSQNIPPNENCHRVQIWGVPEYPQMKIVRES